MCGVLSPRATVQHGYALRERIQRAPPPQHVRAIAEVRAEFVQLEMRELEVPNPAVVQRCAVLAGPRQPRADRAFAVAKHPHRCGERETFSQGRQDCCNAGGRCFEPIERCIMAGGEGRSTRLATKGLDPVSATWLIRPVFVLSAGIHHLLRHALRLPT